MRLHTPHLFVSFLPHARECAFPKEEIDSRRSMNELNRVRAPTCNFRKFFIYFLLHTLIAVNGAWGGGLFFSLFSRDEEEEGEEEDCLIPIGANDLSFKERNKFYFF